VGIFLRTKPRSAPHGFLMWFSPRGFDKVFSHQEGQEAAARAVVVRRQWRRAARCTFLVGASKQFRNGCRSEFGRREGLDAAPWTDHRMVAWEAATRCPSGQKQSRPLLGLEAARYEGACSCAGLAWAPVKCLCGAGPGIRWGVVPLLRGIRQEERLAAHHRFSRGKPPF